MTKHCNSIWSAASKMSLLRFTVIAVCVCFSLTSLTHAQDQQGAEVARIVDSHGDFPCDHTLALLDYFAIELDKSPSSEGYVVAYSGKSDGFGRVPHRLAHAKAYLVNTRAIDESRITIINGGRLKGAGELREEYWIVPEGATPPKTQQTNLENLGGGVTRKYDEGYADFIKDAGKYRFYCCEICGLEIPSISAYVKATKEAGAQAHIILYSGVNGFQTYSDAGRRRHRFSTFASILKSVLTKDYGLTAERINVVFGGKREVPTMELWIVPKGASTPQATPISTTQKDKKR